MYFSAKGRFYRWASQRSARYRYAALFILSSLIATGWLYGLYPWLESCIKLEQAALSQLEQQIMQLSQTEREIQQLESTFMQQRQALSKSSSCCIGPNCSDQCNFLFDQAKQARVQIKNYHTQQLQAKGWKESQIITIGFAGSFDQIENFLERLERSEKMVQCDALDLQHGDGNGYTASCRVKFITPVLNV